MKEITKEDLLNFCNNKTPEEITAAGIAFEEEQPFIYSFLRKEDLAIVMIMYTLMKESK